MSVLVVAQKRPLALGRDRADALGEWLVIDSLQKQAVRRCRRSGKRSVLRRQHLCDPLDRLLATPDVDQCSDDVANHVVKKTIGFDFDRTSVAVEFARFVVDDHAVTNGSYRRLSVASRSLETSKVMRANQSIGGETHGVYIDRKLQMPTVTKIESVSCPLDLKLVTISLANTVTNRMKRIRRIATRFHHNVRRQVCVERGAERFRRRIPVRYRQACYLGNRVDSRVGPTASGDMHAVLGKFDKRAFEHALDRELLRLDLPTGVLRAIVGDRQLEGA